MNREIIKKIFDYIEEIKYKLNYVNKYQLCEELCYSPEEFASLIQRPIYDLSTYLEILEYIDKDLERS